MNIINLDKEKEIAIKAAKLAGKLLKEDKNILKIDEIKSYLKDQGSSIRSYTNG